MSKLPKKRLPVYVDKATCAECGGECCKSMPGIYSPEDFGAPDRVVMKRRIEAAFLANTACVDWWEGKLGGAYSPKHVRPQIARAYGRLRDPSWGGECSLLTPTGCSLAHDDRPYGCRALKPKAEFYGTCTMPKDYKDPKKSGTMQWVKYQDVIEAALASAELSRR